MPTRRVSLWLVAGTAGLLLHSSPSPADGQAPCKTAPDECITTPAPRVIVHVPPAEVIFKQSPPTQVCVPPPVTVQGSSEKHCFLHRLCNPQPTPQVNYGSAPVMTIPVAAPSYGAVPYYSAPAPTYGVPYVPVAAPNYGAVPYYSAPAPTYGVPYVPAPNYGAPPCQSNSGYGSNPNQDLRSDVNDLKDRADKARKDLDDLKAGVDKLSKRVDDVVDLVKEHDKVLKEHDDWIKMQKK